MVIVETPKRHILGGNRTCMPILMQIGPLYVRPVCDRRIKKGEKSKERNLQWQTGCSPRPPTLTQRYVVLHAGWPLGVSSKFQVSSKSDEPFSRCGRSKFPFPIPKASGLYNSLYYRTSRDVVETRGWALDRVHNSRRSCSAVSLSGVTSQSHDDAWLSLRDVFALFDPVNLTFDHLT